MTEKSHDDTTEAEILEAMKEMMDEETYNDEYDEEYANRFREGREAILNEYKKVMEDIKRENNNE